MQDDCTPEASEAAVEKLANEDSRVLSHDKDEVLYGEKTHDSQGRIVNRDVGSWRLEDIVGE